MFKRLFSGKLPELRASRLVDVLRSVAGTPATWRRTRRGSFLVIVVGTLALLAVVAVIYVTIGNQDARMKASLARHDKLQRVINDPNHSGGGAANFDGGGFAQYVAGIIGRDVLSTYYDTNTILSDLDFADWPLGEPAVLDDLTRWAFAHRRLTLLGGHFDEVSRRHARFAQWRRQWSHIVGCRALEDDDERAIPTMLLAPGLVTLKLLNPAQYRASWSTDEPAVE